VRAAGLYRLDSRLPLVPSLGDTLYCATTASNWSVGGIVPELEVHLVRPPGMTWKSYRMYVRPAAAWERRQYAALAKLQIQRERGARAVR